MPLLVYLQAFTKILPMSSLIGLHLMSLSSIWSIKLCWISGVNKFNNFIGHAKALNLKLLKQLLFKVCLQSAEFVVNDSKYHWFPVWPLIHPNRNSNLTQNHLTKTISFLPPLAPFFWQHLVNWPNGFMWIRSNCLLIYLVCCCHTYLLWCSNHILSPACVCWQHFIFCLIELGKLLLKIFDVLLLCLNNPGQGWVNVDVP